VLTVLLLLWSLCLGLGLAQATEAPRTEPPRQNQQRQAQPNLATIGTVDVVPNRYKLGQQLYLENCATCHIGLPPEIMPSETWRQLLPDPQHYGVTIQPLTGVDVQLTWQYMREFSRPQAADEEIPYRVYQSRYFTILHPKVKFSQRVKLNSCATCHPAAAQYDFRRLSSEWENAP
jgi:cytochrome c peroxidase